MAITLSYDNICNLSIGHLNRLRRRNKNNYNRILKHKKKCNLSKNIDKFVIDNLINKLNGELQIYLLNLSLIDNVIHKITNNQTLIHKITNNQTLNLRYNNGQIVPFGSIDYFILTNR